MTAQIRYLSDRVLTDLKKNMGEYIGRYRTHGFQDLADEPGWDVPLGIEFDEKKLSALDLSKPQRNEENASCPKPAVEQRVHANRDGSGCPSAGRRKYGGKQMVSRICSQVR